jgi:uncharacterized damage-inducible protein DinB
MVRDTLLVEFDHEMGTTRRLLERVPDERLSWRPHQKSMSLGGLATHMASLPSWGTFILNHPGVDLAEVPPNQHERTTGREILALFEETTAAARGAMDKSDAEYAAMWTLRRGSQEIFSMPRSGAFRSFVLNHIIHHRGQLSVYLRLNDIPVPAIYGPTADEG